MALVEGHLSGFEILREQTGNQFAGDGISLEGLNVEFRAQITGFDGISLYSWVEGVGSPTTPESFTPRDGGRTGTITAEGCPAFEANGNLVPIGTWVKVRKSYLDRFYGWIHEFDYCCGGGASSSGGSATQRCLVVVVDVFCDLNTNQLVVTKKKICGTFTISDP